MASANSSNAALGLHPNARNLTGVEVGRLTVVGFTGKRNNGELVWLCKCQCGNTVEVCANNLNSKRPTDSCGCLSSERRSARQTTHGMINTPEWDVWQGIIRRCTRPTCKEWSYYGGRGVTICERWLGRDGFANFYADMGPRPTLGHTIDRIDAGGNYQPGNCRWATRREQSRNTRRTIVIEYCGASLPLPDMAALHGVKYRTAWSRLRRGLPLDKVFEKVSH